MENLSSDDAAEKLVEAVIENDNEKVAELLKKYPDYKNIVFDYDGDNVSLLLNIFSNHISIDIFVKTVIAIVTAVLLNIGYCNIDSIVLLCFMVVFLTVVMLCIIVIIVLYIIDI